MSFFRNIMFLLMFAAFAITSCYSRSIEDEITVKVRPGSAECFYETFKSGDELDLEYQVINGEHGELDVDFFLYGVTGNIIKAESRQSDSQHTITFSDPGDYKFCWDNTFSRFSTKTVYFAYAIINPADPDTTDDMRVGYAGNLTPDDDAEELYEMKVEDIKDAVDRIRSQLTKARFTQDAIRAHEARDRNVAENNYTMINSFSLISLVVMITTGAVQVLLLRSLFDEKSKLHKLWHRNGPSLPRF